MPAGSRRAANSSPSADARSSHWASSIATRAGVSSERREDGDEGAADRARVGRARAAEQGGVERVPLRLRELVAHGVVCSADQVGERRVRQLCLALGRLCPQHPLAEPLGCFEAGPPESALPDPGLAFEEQRARLALVPGEEGVDRRELGVAADDRVLERRHRPIVAYPNVNV